MVRGRRVPIARQPERIYSSCTGLPVAFVGHYDNLNGTPVVARMQFDTWTAEWAVPTGFSGYLRAELRWTGCGFRDAQLDGGEHRWIDMRIEAP